jgi:hypothetical protein
MKTRIAIVVFGVLLLCLLCLPVGVSAQAVFGGIAGTVTDSTGAALPGAKITITDVGKGIGYNAVYECLRKLQPVPLDRWSLPGSDRGTGI